MIKEADKIRNANMWDMVGRLLCMSKIEKWEMEKIHIFENKLYNKDSSPLKPRMFLPHNIAEQYLEGKLWEGRIDKNIEVKKARVIDFVNMLRDKLKQENLDLLNYHYGAEPMCIQPIDCVANTIEINFVLEKGSNF